MTEHSDISKIMSEYVQGSDHPDLQVYRREMENASGQEVWLWRTKQFCDLGGFDNAIWEAFTKSASLKRAVASAGMPSASL